jgi:recombination protein RecT
MLDSMKDEFERCLPSILPVDTFMRIALTGFRKTPELAGCTRASILGALMESARLGLAPCTEQSSIVPFKNTRKNIVEATLVIGYEGYIQLMYRSGQVGTVEVEFVYEADEWEYSIGDGGRFLHKPNVLAGKKRGEKLFAYSYASLLSGGRTKIQIVTREEADELKAKYGRRAGSSWNDNFDGMWLKTPVRRVHKYAPKSVDLHPVLAEGALLRYDAGKMMPELVDPDTLEGEVVTPAITNTTPEMTDEVAAQVAALARETAGAS